MKGFIQGICKSDLMVHTRVGQCSMFEGTPKGFIIHDKNTAFPIVETAFNTEIKKGITALGINRVVPLLSGFTDYQPTGGDVRTSQEGFGPEMPIGINAKRVDYIINAGGLCLFKQLKKYNGKQVRLLQVDNNDVAYGTVATIAGVDKVRGFLGTIWVTRRDNTGTNNPAIIFSVFLDANYENEESNLTAVTLTETYEGLTGVILRRTATGTAKFVIACSGDDLTSTFGTTLAVATLYKNPAGANPTTVVYNATSSTLTFTPAAASYKIEDAMVLAAANIEGYEGEDEYTDLT